MSKLAFIAAALWSVAGAAAAQGAGFNWSAGEPRYPANPQYQYPYPYDDARAQGVTPCRQGEVRYRGKCRPARPLALPF
jgi:hypothetical protein